MKYLKGFASFLWTCILYAGLPLLGWGLDDLPGYFALPPRLIYVVSIALFGTLAACQMILLPESFHGGMGQAEKFVPRQRVVRVAVTLMLFAGLVLIPLSDRRSLLTMADSSPLRWIGLILAILGLGLIFWSGLALGRFYSQEVTLQEGHRLITRGPYRLVRHPRYLGIAVMGIGQSLLFRSWLGLALTVLAMVVVLIRIRDEEILMQKEFGAEWEAYARKTKRLIPFVW
ncbi:MAG: isoprenylcysteine carboxylmethyltransferase family protein [Anaerolineales bacterium]|nr:isoprenylcysteine carboxylmethyltransferase family protein [Anaerolineales bacterium]